MINVLNYRRILLSAVVIAFVASLVFAGTQAFFSDTETSTANTFTAGALDLTIDNSSYGFDYNDPNNEDPTGVWGPNENNSWTLRNLDECGDASSSTCVFFDFTDLKPGDYGEDTISLHVQNDAWACMAFDLTSTPDNGINDPEDDAGDVTDGDDGGELQNFLSFLFWYDDGDNVLEVGEEVIPELSGLPGSIFSGDWLPIAEGGDIPLAAEATTYIGKGWCFGEITADPEPDNGQTTDGAPTADTTGFTCDGSGDHNIAQTDGIEVDVHFYAEQARNNDQFMCSDLPAPDGGDDNGTSTPRELVGAAAVAYEAPTSTCAITVSSDESIQAAVDGAADNAIVCVDTSYDGTGDDAAIRIETLGLTLASTPQGAVLDVPVVLSNSNVTVTGFAGVIGQAESPAEQAAFYLDNDADGAVVSHNTVSGGAGAAVLTESGAALGGGLIANNTFDGATQGIYLNPHTGTIVVEYNDFDDNVVGVAGLNGATVRYNQFTHTTPGSEAIGIDSTFDANPGVVNFNNFLNDMMLNTYGTITPTIDAENNFFSTSGASQVDDNGGTNTVDFDPEEGSAFPHN